MSNITESTGSGEFTELTGTQLGIITSDFILVADKLKEASYTLRTQGNFTYPIFPMSKVPIQIGGDQFFDILSS